MPLTHSFTHRSYHSIQFIHAIIINDRGPKKRTSSTGNSQQTIIIRSGGQTDGRTSSSINLALDSLRTCYLFMSIRDEVLDGHIRTTIRSIRHMVSQLGSHLAAKPTLAPKTCQSKYILPNSKRSQHVLPNIKYNFFFVYTHY